MFWVTLAALATLVHIRLVPAGYVQHEKRDALHEQTWVKRAPMHTGVLVPVYIGLTQSNLDKGEDILLDISDPASPSYGRHLSQEEIADLFAPAQDRIDAVKTWLTESIGHRKVVLSPSRQWLQFNATIAELQELVHADYHEYEHLHSGKAALACEDYHIPEEVQPHLDLIVPGVKSLELRKRGAPASRRALTPEAASGLQLTQGSIPDSKTATDLSNCSFAITPACVRALYDIHDVHVPHPKNSIGIYENEDQFYNQTDLNKFFKIYAPEIPQGAEADLDFQAIYPLVYGDKVVNYQVDDGYWETKGAYDVVGLFNTFLDALDKSYCTYSAYGVTGDSPPIDPAYPDPNPGGYKHPHQCGAFQPTNVISFSWFDQGIVPVNYERRQCNEWMKLGLQGVSVLFGSGDWGVAWQDNICDGNGSVFRPLTPQDCPYVTAVGATQLPAGGIPGKTPETASTNFSSGGGFSPIFPRAKYQEKAVASYFEKHPPPYPYFETINNRSHPFGRYNRIGRGFPDVAAIGQNISIIDVGKLESTRGTSASAPFFAAMITRINAVRLHAGKKPIGFLNPILYEHPEIFNDIVEGSNPGCGTNGFSAVEGWDPVTGLGTPKYPQLKKLLTSLP